MENSWCVYVHTFPNGKQYFGITKREPEKRWVGGYGYLKGGKSDSAMANAVRKYGWENVRHDILFDGLTLDEANWLEQWFIFTYKTNVCRYGTEFGYNSTDGGDGNNGHRMSEESKRKMSIAKKGKPIKGLVVVCDGIEYKSVKSFAETVGLKRECVKQWLNGKNKMPQYWFDKGLRYRDKVTNIKPQEIPHEREVIFYDKTYRSISELAREMDDDFRNISSYLTGHRKMPKQYTDGGLRYAESQNHK